MSKVCSKCQGFGFVDSQGGYPVAIPFSVVEMADNFGEDHILYWMRTEDYSGEVRVCDCCGNGGDGSDGEFYHERGEHKNKNHKCKP